MKGVRETFTDLALFIPEPIRAHFQYVRAGTFAEKAKPRVKFVVNFIASIALLIWMQENYIARTESKLSFVLRLSERAQALNLAYFDWAIFLALGLGIIFVLPFIFDLILLIKKSFNRVYLSAVLVFLLTVACTIYLPFHFFRMGREISIDYSVLLDRGNFIYSALFLSSMLALSVADRMRDWDQPHLHHLLFILLPAPILWWNSLRLLFPGRIWMFFKPALLLLTLMPPFFAFFMHPRLIPTIEATDPVEISGTVREISGCSDSYQIFLSTSPGEVYLNCNRNLERLIRNADGWNVQASYSPGFAWDEASFDFQNDRVYIFDGWNRRLLILRLPDLEFEQSISYSAEDFPEQNEGIHQTLLSRGTKLIVAENEGRIIAIDTNDLQIKQSMKLPKNAGQIWRLLPAQTPDQFLVLRKFSLDRFSTGDFHLTGNLPLEHRAVDMMLDKPTRRLFVSFPRIMKVGVYDSQTLSPITQFSGPPAVRNIAIDNKRNLLFVGSYAGSIDVRDATTFKRAARFQLYPWQRRILALPDSGVLLASSSQNVLEHTYDPLLQTFDFQNWVRGRAEFLLKWLILSQFAYAWDADPAPPTQVDKQMP